MSHLYFAIKNLLSKRNFFPGFENIVRVFKFYSENR